MMVEERETVVNYGKTNGDAVVFDVERQPEQQQASQHHHPSFNLPHLHMPHLSMPQLNLRQQIRDVEVFENGITYLVYLTAPLNLAMLGVGFAHRDDCPADVRLPRYLFFGGAAGLMAALLRVVMEFKWRSIAKQQQGIKFDPKLHPGLGMVRTIMYLFMIFVLAWNIDASSHIFSFVPDTEDVDSVHYCHPAAYNMAYGMVIVTDFVVGVFFVVWIGAIIAGLCHPDFLVLHGYYPSISEIGFKKLSPKKRRKEKARKEAEENAVLDEQRRRRTVERSVTVDVGEVMKNNMGNDDHTVEPKEERAMANLRRLREMKQARDARNAVVTAPSGVNSNNENNGSSNRGRFSVRAQTKAESTTSDDEDDEDTTVNSSVATANADDEEHDLETTLSIVRFAREVSLRRISCDVRGIAAGGSLLDSDEAGRGGAGAAAAKLDITNFPSGPLVKDGAKGETEAMEMKERKI